MTDAARQLREQEEELQRIRRKRRRSGDHEQARRVLNIAFLIVTAIGFALYFLMPDNRVPSLCVMGAGMVLKVAEIFLRFML